MIHSAVDRDAHVMVRIDLQMLFLSSSLLSFIFIIIIIIIIIIAVVFVMVPSNNILTSGSFLERNSCIGNGQRGSISLTMSLIEIGLCFISVFASTSQKKARSTVESRVWYASMQQLFFVNSVDSVCTSRGCSFLW
mmetsp:Transcript_40798/g.65586  ORF Transcript_40798/g.65586 Transcript_40798/m.65586 type:complete len:136 (+) Transcript_40798:101-508(+)